MRAVDLLCLAVVVTVGATLALVPAKADRGYGQQWYHGYSNQHESWEHHYWRGPRAFFAPPPTYSPPPAYYSAPPQITPLSPPPTFYGPPVSSFSTAP